MSDQKVVSYTRTKEQLLRSNQKLSKIRELFGKRLYKHAKNIKFTKMGRTVKNQIMGEVEDHLQSLVDIQNYLDYLKKIINSSGPGGEKNEHRPKETKTKPEG